jgi:hypothetical protein
VDTTEQACGAFTQIPRTARGHFVLNFYAAIYRLVYHVGCLNQVGEDEVKTLFAQYPFLAEYFAEISRCLPQGTAWDAGWTWWQTEIEAWEADCPEPLPLTALAEQMGLGFRERIALMIVGLPEEDSRFGTLYMRLQEPLPYRRPCLELVEHVMRMPDRFADAGVTRELLALGLVEAHNQDVARSEWLLRVPSVLWDVLRGEEKPELTAWCRHHPPTSFTLPEALILPEDFRRRIEQAPQLVRQGKVDTIVLRGTQGSERLETLGAIARALNLGVIACDGAALAEPRHLALLKPLCAMTRSLPAITYDPGPGELVEAPALQGYHGPVGVLLGTEGGLKGALLERSTTLTIPPSGPAERYRCWQDMLPNAVPETLAAINERFLLPCGYIRQAAPLAMNVMALDRRDAVTTGDVQEACRALNRQMLDTLATRLDADGAWDRLVVSPATLERLQDLQRRCRYRERLSGHLGAGFGSMPTRGVRALFSGVSGTGKTLAARILAAELGMDLYRVDLAAVVNKYIGETEKNLSRVLAHAEELDVVLLLDEGDALLGRRTDVKSSNDRYANLETNYLLQRLEHYQGILLVTTNAGENIDTAFQRRMDVVVNFLTPQAQERLHIWRLHLPQRHEIDYSTLEEIAQRCALSGGQIRNIALHATLLALDSDGLLTQDTLHRALESEYRKAGAVNPLRLTVQVQSESPAIASFVEAFSW